MILFPRRYWHCPQTFQVVTAGGMRLTPSRQIPSQPRMMRSPGLKGFKQVRSLTQAEDTGLSCTEFYSAGRNPNNDLAEFLFLKLKACKEAWYIKQKGDSSPLIDSGSGNLGVTHALRTWKSPQGTEPEKYWSGPNSFFYLHMKKLMAET